MFPISDSTKSNKFPYITILIIVANIFAFYQMLTVLSQDLFIKQYALVPSAISFVDLATLAPFVTALFLHGGFFHILSNMWFLWIFGDNVEAHLGKIKYLLLYFIAGVVGNVAQFALNPSSSIPIIGASGAVSGVLGAYFILFPRSNIKTLLILFLFITVTDIPAVIYIFYWFVIQLFSGIASLPFSYQAGGIAFWAHIGGFLAGVWIARSFKNNSGKNEYIEGEIVEG